MDLLALLSKSQWVITGAVEITWKPVRYNIDRFGPYIPHAWPACMYSPISPNIIESQCALLVRATKGNFSQELLLAVELSCISGES